MKKLRSIVSCAFSCLDEIAMYPNTTAKQTCKRSDIIHTRGIRRDFMGRTSYVVKRSRFNVLLRLIFLIYIFNVNST